MNTGKRIQCARKKAGLTQKELAQKCGVAEITIRQYEAGKREPRIAQLEKIAKALDINVLVLLGDISYRLSNELTSEYDTSSDPLIIFLKGLYDKVDIQQAHDANGKYYTYVLGDQEPKITISELTYDNMYESIEDFIKLYVKTSQENGNKQECFYLMCKIKNMNTNTLKELIDYVDFLNSKAKQ